MKKFIFLSQHTITNYRPTIWINSKTSSIRVAEVEYYFTNKNNLFLFCDLIWINFSTTNNFCYKFIKKLRSFSQKWSKSEQISAILVQIQSILVQIALCIVVLCRHKCLCKGLERSH